MKIQIFISMTGRDKWTEGGDGNGFGQTMARSHSFEIEYGDDVSQHEALASAIERIIEAVNPPRPGQILAQIVDDILEERNISGEKKFRMAAKNVLEAWRAIDDISNGDGE